MNRRALGAALLLLTVVLAAGVPRALGTQLPGVAVAEMVPRPPIVGACVLQDLKTQPATRSGVAAVSYGTCRKPHYGEVVEVYSDYRAFPHIRIDQVSTPDPETCTAGVNGYLNVDQVLPRSDRGDYLSVSFAPWLPVSTGSVGLLGPSALQAAVGQHWIACVTQGNSSAAFAGTVRNAFSGGGLPDSYAVCSNQLSVQEDVDCTSPHHSELFADTPITDTLPSPASLTTSCKEFVGYLTGRTDLSAAGELRVEALTVHYGITGHPTPGQSAPVQTQPARAFCGITTTGTHTLTGTLFALRDRPLPLT